MAGKIARLQRLGQNLWLSGHDELLAHLVDDGTISAEAANAERCRERGICSESDCEQAIDGWCEFLVGEEDGPGDGVGCGAKLCRRHLREHLVALIASTRDVAAELVAVLAAFDEETRR